MGVVGFHRLLISAAILFCVGYGIWELLRYAEGAGSAGTLVTAGVFFVLAVGLGYYLVNLGRFLHRDD